MIVPPSFLLERPDLLRRCPIIGIVLAGEKGAFDFEFRHCVRGIIAAKLDPS
jgi:hypothetical protein